MSQSSAVTSAGRFVVSRLLTIDVCTPHILDFVTLGFDVSMVVVLVVLSVCLCVCLGAGARPGADRPVKLDQQRSLPLMICFFDRDPGDPEQFAQINSMPDREACADSSTSSTVSSVNCPWRPCTLCQSDILNTRNIVHVLLQTAEHVNLVT